jgi:hypothetical protein
MIGEPSLTDQFNHSYQMEGAIANTAPGSSQAAAFFPPLVEPAASWGARLTLRIRELRTTDPGQRDVAGDWSLFFTLIRTPGVTLSPPPAGELAGKPVTFWDLQVHRGTISIVIRISNSTVSELGRIVPDSLKGHSALGVTLWKGSETAPGAGMQWRQDGQAVLISAVWLVSQGTYNLELSYEGHGSLVRQIDVPSAAGPGQK